MSVFTTKNQIFKTITIAAALITVVLFAQNVHAAKKEVVSLGKVFVAADLDKEGFPVKGREDATGVLQQYVKNDKELELVYEEDDADFKIVITGVRNPSNNTVVEAALYVRDGDNWKPGTRIKTERPFSRGQFALDDCKNDAKKWIKSQAKNR